MHDFKPHLLDFLKGLLAAMATSMLITGLQYVGAHVPELIGFATTTIAAVGTIKVAR